MKDNNLIERYIHEVGRHLPKKNRADVTLEIRSALEDILEERGLDAESEVSKIEEILIEYGNPQKVAASYHPERWLIGPRLYPTFERVLKIALIVIGTIALISFSFDLASNGFSLLEFGQFIGTIQGGFFTTLGVVVLVFFILERAGVVNEKEEDGWKPSSLPKVEDPDQINRGELIISILFTIAALIIMNYYPNLVGIHVVQDGEWLVTPLLTSEFIAFIPWLSVLWALEIALKAEVLRRGTWNRFSRFAEFAISAFGIFILFRILTGGPILSLPILGIPILSVLVKGALSIALIVSMIKLIGQGYKLARSLVDAPTSILNEIS